MKKLIAVLILYIATSQFSYSAELVKELAADQINKLVINTTYHGTTSAKNIALLEVIGGMESGCNGVFFDAETNKAAYSMLMSAIVSKANVTIHYDPTQHSPWGNTTWCALTVGYIKP